MQVDYHFWEINPTAPEKINSTSEWHIFRAQKIAFKQAFL